MIRRSVRGATALFADGDDLAEKVTAISGRECHFLPSFRRFRLKMLPQPREKFFLFLGKLEKNRGVFDLLKAFAMSGRSGTGVKARDFIELVKQKVIEKADHPLEEHVASSLAAAAIRYYLLKFTLESQIIFDFDEALKTTGDTGVYLEYAHARACSILRKAEEKKMILRRRVCSSRFTATET
jgi:arginyl-tRNA synthetase